METTNKYSGLVFNIIDELAKKLNFTYSVEAIAIPDKTKNTAHISSNVSEIDNLGPGDILTNWISPIMMDMVKNKSIVIGAYATTLSDDLKDFIDFTIPISFQRYTFLAARPKVLSRALLFMAPFSGDTWLCLIAAILSVGPLLYYIHRNSPIAEESGDSGGLMSIQNCIWYMYGALLQQGGMHLPKADSARTLVGAWWLVVLVIATTYCGNLVAFLTFPEMDKPLTTFDDLIRYQDKITWTIRDHSYLEEELKNIGDSKLKVLYHRRSKNQTEDAILAEVSQGHHVLIDWKIRLQFLMSQQDTETNRCDFALG
ncbi:hypothetical protein HHI36_016266 [Cryptolaemus montrouzieri]|uniref:Ionotropic glutamate receptor C-terminal domain-containing protein n=1 Tax=Cryptolaemus montrouzieri TaxID=559131 RepID=A0ABD2NJ70_9CUCU